jgi:hypothetical protein
MESFQLHCFLSVLLPAVPSHSGSTAGAPARKMALKELDTLTEALEPVLVKMMQVRR